MLKKDLYDYGYGTVWTEVHVNYREGYSTSVTDYHEHDFYEINLILSGNVKILLGDHAEEGTENRVVLTRPKTPHYIACKPDTLYSRLYLVFTGEFVDHRIPEWQDLSLLFGEKGNVISLNAEQTEECKALIEQIRLDPSPFRKRLLIYCLLSRLSELADMKEPISTTIPPYILEAITYLENHYPEKILSEHLARELHVGRTTLMLEFKKHTGSTLGDYLCSCRLRHALRLLEEGKTMEYAAAQCGFSDSSVLARSFRRQYGTTPRNYLKKSKTI